MCIVSFAIQDRKAIITFNRDEDPNRPFNKPESFGNNHLFYPTDKVSGGTWIGKNKNYIISLQNGSLLKHKRELPYSRSRGLILMELLNTDRHETVFEVLQSEKIEPFTIHVFNIHSFELTVYVYDGTELNKNYIKNPENYLQCSSTLYNPENIETIRSNFLSLKIKSNIEIMDFHRRNKIGGIDNQFIKKPSTSSITQFSILGDKVNCLFEDLITSQISSYKNC